MSCVRAAHSKTWRQNGAVCDCVVAALIALFAGLNTTVVGINGYFRGSLTVATCLLCCAKLVTAQHWRGSRHPWGQRANFIRLSAPLFIRHKLLCMAILVVNAVWACKSPALAYIIKRVQETLAGCETNSDCITKNNPGGYCMNELPKIAPFSCHGQDPGIISTCTHCYPCKPPPITHALYNY